MNKLTERIFTTRSTVTLEIPLTNNIRILHPEQVILKIGKVHFDLGAFCYAIRSHKRRKHRQPRDVVIDSFLKQRPKQILQLIKGLSHLVMDGGKRKATAICYAKNLISFLNWADANGMHECLSGGNTTRIAYLAWAKDTHERYLRQEFGEVAYNHRLKHIRELLEATTALKGLHHGTHSAKEHRNLNGGTDPLAPRDFVQAVAICQSLFDGLCDLVLEHRPFPCKLVLPATLGWTENHLWIFPTNMWRLPPHKWGTEREKLGIPSWPYNYVEGRLATPKEIIHRYSTERYPSQQYKKVRRLIAKAQTRIREANANERDWTRIMLGSLANSAFLFLFFCNTGANESVIRDIETDGEIDAASANQHFRSVKFRAGGKPVSLIVPAAFMPSLRRFMELRRYLLNAGTFPYLFFTLGKKVPRQPGQIGTSPLFPIYSTIMRAIDPQIPRMGSRKLRATVADWYQRHHDSSVTAKVLQNSEETTQKHYDAGSAIDHRVEISVFLNSVSESAKRQRVTLTKESPGSRPLEEGGRCDSFGHPRALAGNVPILPNCKASQGCLFCVHRVLVADEEDARKVASAAFVMEQVILGPQHEEALRPLITKCDKDLEKIAAFGNCRVMVERVRKDVFMNGNLTPYFADKYQLFLELGVAI